jgi:hypothetical protein
MTRAYVGTLPNGSKGFDCDTRVTPDAARRMRDAGYLFAGRYVRRATPHSDDLSIGEVMTLLDAGLGVTVFQHVAAPGWMPSESLGASYGAIAAEEARQLGIPPNVVLWCDLEGVSTIAASIDTIKFCNAWYDAVRSVQYDAGLYVGWHCGISGHDLYYRLKFRRYAAAYNLDGDGYPAVRGVCMQQGSYPPPGQRVEGVPFEYDTQLVERDKFNNLPAMLLPRDPG